MAQRTHNEPEYTVARFLLGTLPDSFIAKITAYSRQAIKQMRSRKGIEPASVRVVEIADYEITDYPDLGEISDEVFAKKYKVSVNYARTLRRTANLPTPKEKERHQKEKEILKYAGKMSDYAAAKKAKTNPVQVLRVRHSHNIPSFVPTKKSTRHSQ